MFVSIGCALNRSVYKPSGVGIAALLPILHNSSCYNVASLHPACTAAQPMKQKKDKKQTRFVSADPKKWSEESKRSLSYVLFAPDEYADKHYLCWSCRKPATFTAADQKYTYEVKKAYIHQRRVLCPECWMHRLKIERDLKECETQWADSKELLKDDRNFLAHWLDLLLQHDRYEPYRKNLAIQNMLKKLMA